MNENPSLVEHIIMNDSETEMNKMIKEKKLDLNDKIPEYTTKLSLLIEINEQVTKIVYKKEDDELKYYSYENILCLNEMVLSISDHLPPVQIGLPVSSIITDICHSYAVGVVDVTYLYASVRVEYPLGEKFMELAKDEYNLYGGCDVSKLLDDILWDIYIKFDSDEDLRFITLCAKLSALLPFSTQHLLKNKIVERYPTILEKALFDWVGSEK